MNVSVCCVGLRFERNIIAGTIAIETECSSRTSEERRANVSETIEQQKRWSEDNCEQQKKNEILRSHKKSEVRTLSVSHMPVDLFIFCFNFLHFLFEISLQFLHFCQNSDRRSHNIHIQSKQRHLILEKEQQRTTIELRFAHVEATTILWELRCVVFFSIKWMDFTFLAHILLKSIVPAQCCALDSHSYSIWIVRYRCQRV